jgi:hypothetical protein
LLDVLPGGVAVTLAASVREANREVTKGQLAVTLAATATIRAGEEPGVVAGS